MLGVEYLNALGFHVYQTIDDGALQFSDVHSAPEGASVKVVLVNIACHGGGHQIVYPLARRNTLTNLG